MCDQIALFAFHSFLVQFQTKLMLATHAQEIRIADFYCFPQQSITLIYTMSYGSTGKLLGCQLFENFSIHDE